jgi:uncharacterized protein with HEPN domain
MPSSAGTGGFRTPFGDILLPVLLGALGEKTGAVIDNLDRAERLGMSPSAEQWLEMRKMRNQMVHDPATMTITCTRSSCTTPAPPGP